MGNRIRRPPPLTSYSVGSVSPARSGPRRSRLRWHSWSKAWHDHAMIPAPSGSTQMRWAATSVCSRSASAA